MSLSITNSSYIEILNTFSIYNKYIHEIDTFYKQHDPKDYSMWKDIKKSNTISAYKKYLKQFPKGVFAEDAICMIEIVQSNNKWKKIKNSQNTIDYSLFMKKYPNSKYFEKAKEKLDSLSEKEKVVWVKTLKIDTANAYYDYMMEYPSGAYLDDAKKRYKEKKNNNVFKDIETGLVWQDNHLVSYNLCNKTQIQDKVDRLNRNKFAGYNKWRVPTINELISLYKKRDKLENRSFDKHECYWSSSVQIKKIFFLFNITKYDCMYFNNSKISSFRSNSKKELRCVCESEK